MMNQIKIGRFIADMRKKQGLTQKQLADMLNVTDKTISKWETGCRLPDASVLLDLSGALAVDINELLAGEEFAAKNLSSEEYARKSEGCIVGLVGELNEIDRKNRSRSIGTAAGTLLIGAACLYMFAFSLRSGRWIDLFDFPTLSCLLGLKLLILAVSDWFHDYLNGWKTILPKTNLPEQDIASAIQAVKYAGALTLTLGGAAALLGLFSLLNYSVNLDNREAVWSVLAQVVLALLYSAIELTVYIILVFNMKKIKK